MQLSTLLTDPLIGNRHTADIIFIGFVVTRTTFWMSMHGLKAFFLPMCWARAQRNQSQRFSKNIVFRRMTILDRGCYKIQTLFQVSIVLQIMSF